MTSSRDHSADRRQHAGQWILLDAGLRLLAIGQALYHGTSPRASLDLTARRILLPQLASAGADRWPRSTVTEDFGRRWIVHIRPILGAASGQLVAVLGCYGPADTQLPEPPLVGSWEWLVTPPGPNQQMRIYWSTETFAVYGMHPPTGRGPHWWEAPQWLDEVVAESHRPGVRRILERFLATPSGALRIHRFAARSIDAGHVHALRLAG
ncbi:hypothetical protein ACFQ1S_10435, partial [Kibdelosporangium lantanae]